MDSSIPFFTGNGPESGDRITGRNEKEIVNWLATTREARELLLDELRLPANTYLQTGITEPLVEANRRRPPGDIDLILVPDVCHAVAIQVKRVRIIAETTHRDHTPGRQLGNITRLLEQANGSRDIGFCENYALVLVQCYGPARSGYNCVSRGSSPGVFRNIYHMTWNQPIQEDVGVIFVEIAQPTRASVDTVGTIAVCVDKPAVPLDQSSEITTRVRNLVTTMSSM